MSTISRLPITKARINLGQIARRAHNNNEYFILEKDGIPVIGIMAADELEDYLELRDPKVKASIAASQKDCRAHCRRATTKTTAASARTVLEQPGFILDELVNAVVAMSEIKIGSLIVIERNTGLRSYVESGVSIDATISEELIRTIFYPNTLFVPN